MYTLGFKEWGMGLVSMEDYKLMISR
jgi:hypothetical protein